MPLASRPRLQKVPGRGGIFFLFRVNLGGVAREGDPQRVGRRLPKDYQGGMMVFSFSPRYGWMG